jgi:hypothetical protein
MILGLSTHWKFEIAAPNFFLLDIRQVLSPPIWMMGFNVDITTIFPLRIYSPNFLPYLH